MAEVDRRISITFSSHAQGLRALKRVVMETLQYDSNDRPSAQEVYDKVMDILRAMIRLQALQRQSRLNNSYRSSNGSAGTTNSTRSTTIRTSRGRVVKLSRVLRAIRIIRLLRGRDV